MNCSPVKHFSNLLNVLGSLANNGKSKTHSYAATYPYLGSCLAFLDQRSFCVKLFCLCLQNTSGIHCFL